VRAVSQTHQTLLVTLAAFVTRLAWGLYAHLPNIWDADLYERGARAIASGLGYSCFLFGPLADPHVATAYYPVGYPAYLAFFYVLFGVAPWVVTLAGALAGAVTTALTHRLALRVATPRGALVAALIFSSMPGQVMFAVAPMTETLWATLLAANVWLFARGAPWYARALCLTAAVYVRPQALPLVVLLPLLDSHPWKIRVRNAAVMVVAVCALVAPWSIRNCASLDGCIFVSANGGSNLAVGTIARSDGTYLQLTPEDGCRDIRGEYARDRCWRDVALKNIRENPLRWALRAKDKIKHTFWYERFPVSYVQTGRPHFLSSRTERIVCAVLTWTWRLSMLGALVALCVRRSREAMGQVGVFSLGTLGVVCATHAVFFGGDRYHLPVGGLVLVLAASLSRALSISWTVAHRVRREVCPPG
jgi:hypothetical protein